MLFNQHWPCDSFLLPTTIRLLPCLAMWQYELISKTMLLEWMPALLDPACTPFQSSDMEVFPDWRGEHHCKVLDSVSLKNWLIIIIPIHNLQPVIKGRDGPHSHTRHIDGYCLYGTKPVMSTEYVWINCLWVMVRDPTVCTVQTTAMYGWAMGDTTWINLYIIWTNGPVMQELQVPLITEIMPQYCMSSQLWSSSDPVILSWWAPVLLLPYGNNLAWLVRDVMLMFLSNFRLCFSVLNKLFDLTAMRYSHCLHGGGIDSNDVKWAYTFSLLAWHLVKFLKLYKYIWFYSHPNTNLLHTNSSTQTSSNFLQWTLQRSTQQHQLMVRSSDTSLSLSVID